MIIAQQVIIAAACDFPGCKHTIRSDGRNIGECYQQIRKHKWIIRLFGSYCRCPEHKYKHKNGPLGTDAARLK